MATMVSPLTPMSTRNQGEPKCPVGDAALRIHGKVEGRSLRCGPTICQAAREEGDECDEDSGPNAHLHLIATFGRGGRVFRPALDRQA